MAFREQIFDHLFNSKRKDFLILSLDFGSPSLEAFTARQDTRLLNVGIGEQNAVAFAAGLWDAGIYPIVYSISSFLYSRAHEQIRFLFAMQNRKGLFIGVGSGYGYAFDGPSHHAIDEVSAIGALPNISLYKPSNAKHLGETLEGCLDNPKFSYFRLDRGSSDFQLESLEQGTFYSTNTFSVSLTSNRAIISSGLLFNELVEIYHPRFSMINLHTLNYDTKSEFSVFIAGRFVELIVIGFEYEIYSSDALVRAAVDNRCAVRSIGVNRENFKHYNSLEKIKEELIYDRFNRY